jgi:hypothetical protein
MNDFVIRLNGGHHQRSFQKAGGPACWIWVTIPFHAFGKRKLPHFYILFVSSFSGLVVLLKPVLSKNRSDHPPH